VQEFKNMRKQFEQKILLTITSSILEFIPKVTSKLLDNETKKTQATEYKVCAAECLLRRPETFFGSSRRK
jgi:hypothetical protein